MTYHPRYDYTGVMKTDGVMDRKEFDEQYLYQVQILGEIDQTRIDWFAKMGFESSPNHAGDPVTTITGTIIDQSHLRGMLNEIWDLNFEVILVRRLGKISRMGGTTNE